MTVKNCLDKHVQNAYFGRVSVSKMRQNEKLEIGQQQNMRFLAVLQKHSSGRAEKSA